MAGLDDLTGSQREVLEALADDKGADAGEPKTSHEIDSWINSNKNHFAGYDAVHSRLMSLRRKKLVLRVHGRPARWRLSAAGKKLLGI